MKTTRLVEDRQSCFYSRCGRTDAGVSALGQVCLHVQSSIVGLVRIEGKTENLPPTKLIGKTNAHNDCIVTIEEHKSCFGLTRMKIFLPEGSNCSASIPDDPPIS